MPSPVALRPEQVPDDLICSVCMTIPADPVITPCEHVFCRQCIHRALAASGQCPIDREPCSVNGIRELRGCLFRVWSNIQVKCEHHDGGCAWKGSMGDYASHLGQCGGARGGSDSQEELETLTLALKKENCRLKKMLKNRPNVPPLFHGQYDYSRENVVQLSQLISRYLENKPAGIDSNRIYNCVRSCFLDLQRRYRDNPKHYRMDMKMLLATCEASTWFSDRQRENFKQWYQEEFS